jgi:hypothetical protein
MAEKSEEQEGKDLARRHQESEGETRERVEEVRAKQERGETLTREEAGLLGAQASVERTRQERREAEAQGKGAEFEREHRTTSWTSDPGETREPHLSKGTEGEVARIQAKQERGETLTRSEAGKLGGAARAGGSKED